KVQLSESEYRVRSISLALFLITQSHTQTEAVMFDFQKLSVYQKAKDVNKQVIEIIADNSFDRHVNDQLKRASFSILLNLAEGSSRFSSADRRRFMVMARGSAFECVAVLDFLREVECIDVRVYNDLLGRYEEISKMLYSLIKKFS
ncbi:MAG TPA: four helix bundle protein, partial [Bacteroidales bacterium]|nr:four helix bundle protein [Bacteroidales bacterium]